MLWKRFYIQYICIQKCNTSSYYFWTLTRVWVILITVCGRVDICFELDVTSQVSLCCRDDFQHCELSVDKATFQIISNFVLFLFVALSLCRIFDCSHLCFMLSKTFSQLYCWARLGKHLKEVNKSKQRLSVLLLLQCPLDIVFNFFFRGGSWSVLFNINNNKVTVLG